MNGEDEPPYGNACFARCANVKVVNKNENCIPPIQLQVSEDACVISTLHFP
jgi:hypothetical protein